VPVNRHSSPAAVGISYATTFAARESPTVTSDCYTSAVIDRSHYPVRKGTLHDESHDETLAHLSPAARIAMVWSLTAQAWQFKEPAFHEPRLRRDVVRTLRGGR
jgi:hypothetical protein